MAREHKTLSAKSTAVLGLKAPPVRLEEWGEDEDMHLRQFVDPRR